MELPSGSVILRYADPDKLWKCNHTTLTTLKDFETEFKPTKWSISSFKAYCKSMKVEESIQFIQYAIIILSSRHASRTKGLDIFIQKVSAYHDHLQMTLLAEKENKIPFPINQIVVKKNQREILDFLMSQFKDGAFDCSSHKLTTVLSACFDFGLHPTTIRDKFSLSRKK